MSDGTATIRVSRETRDLLAQQARHRGISIAALMEEIATQRHAEASWRSEREATNLDATNPDVADEDRTWEASLADGLG